MMKNSEKWDKVYNSYSPNNLPWYGLPIMNSLKNFLNSIRKEDLIILTGCGVGDTVDALNKEGFSKIIGTDISKKAIAISQKRFPKLKFECIGTENLDSKYANANIIDWLNLHQISPKDLPRYLKSLDNSSNKLCITYFYDPKRPNEQKSMIAGGLIYNHKPEIVCKLIKKKILDDKVFYTGTNKRFKVKDKFRTVSIIFI
jgi:hypothetical protein